MRLAVLRLALVLASCLVATPAKAYSPARPQRHDVLSQNGKYVLDVDPAKKVNTVYSATDRTKAIWEFQDHLWLCEVMLSNDGAVVVVVQWRFVKQEYLPDLMGVSFRNKDGAFKSWSVGDLFPNP